jgi:hypothetical protein
MIGSLPPLFIQVLQSFEDALLDALKRYTFAEIAPNINVRDTYLLGDVAIAQLTLFRDGGGDCIPAVLQQGGLLVHDR